MAEGYLWGTHAAALATAEGLKSSVFPPARAALVVAAAVSSFVWAGEQQYGNAASSVWGPATAPAAVPGAAPLRFIWVSQELPDRSDSRWVVRPSLAKQGPVPPTIFASQDNPWQTQPLVWKSAVTPPTIAGRVPATILVGPQADPTQIGAWVRAAQPATFKGRVNVAEYHFGTHALALYRAEAIKSFVWAPVPAPPVVVGPVPQRFISSAPEPADFSIFGWVVGATQANQGPVPPLVSTTQADPMQGLAQIWKSQPAAIAITPNPIATFFSVPPQTEDRPTSIIWRTLFSGKTPTVPPLASGAPQYDPSQIDPRVWPSVRTPPAVLGVTVWPTLIVSAQFDSSINPTQLWTTSTFSHGVTSPTTPIVTETFSGGWEYARRARRRREEELRLEREQWGILPKAAQIISAIAIRQADALGLDAQQRLEELESELELAGVQYRARYLELLNIQRQTLIDAEIKGFFEAQEALNEENKRRLLLLLAFL
jgi:hypothetical protein